MIRNTMKPGAGSFIPEDQLSFFFINHDLLVLIHVSFEDHF